MNYIASINAYENLSAPENTNGVMVTGESIAETNTQRLLMQSLLLLEPETPNDPRLKQLQECQTSSWLKKLRNNSQKQLCVRLPDGPIETLLPSLASDFDQLSEFMGCTEEWLRARVKAVWDKHRPQSGGADRRHHPLCRAENLRHDHGGGGKRQL